MPAPAHIKVTVSGVLATLEVWTNTFALDLRLAQFSDPVLGAASLQGMAELIANEYGPVWTSTLAQHVGSGSNFNKVRCTQYLGTGLQFAYGERNVPSPPPGSGTVTHPPQIACVVSLRSGLVGPSGRGRMYFPATGVDMGPGDNTMNATAQAQILGGHVQVFNAIHLIQWTGDFVGSGRVCIASNAGDGSLPIVTRLQVGSVFDTQRRRRDAIEETYLQSVLA